VWFIQEATKAWNELEQSKAKPPEPPAKQEPPSAVTIEAANKIMRLNHKFRVSIEEQVAELLKTNPSAEFRAGMAEVLAAEASGFANLAHELDERCDWNYAQQISNVNRLAVYE
jgi:hypothetical protein